MFGLFRRARRLRELGILGMNARNAEYILAHNARGRMPLVDDKLLLHERCASIGVPTPSVFGVVRRFADLARLDDMLAGRHDFVLKPNRGSGGRGILVIVKRLREKFVGAGAALFTAADLRDHLCGILSGFHSLGGLADQALLQQRVRLHPAFGPISYRGIPDVRIVLYRQEPAMAMLRLPTRVSGGRANLHQGGIGVGVDLDTGRTHHAVLNGQPIANHPDTRMPLVGRQVPHWAEILDMSRRIARETALGYLGVDIVVDAERGPLLLEANARPGLAIQLANRQGLRPCLKEIEAQRRKMVLASR